MERNAEKIRKFQRAVWNYHRHHKRDFPWRRTADPYRVLVSEVMLQQTQTARVVPKYKLFLRYFPSFRALARASARKVLKAWQGLGYNRRALNLKKASEIVIREYGGILPRDVKPLQKLPGVGPATAGAVAAFAFNMPVPFLETNIRRAFIHFFFPRRKKVRDEEILKLAEKTMDRKNPREWYWALMDYGAALGAHARRSPGQGVNPNVRSVQYTKQPRFRGSNRELRGKVLKALVNRKIVTRRQLDRIILEDPIRLESVVHELEREGFVRQRGEKIAVVK